MGVTRLPALCSDLDPRGEIARDSRRHDPGREHDPRPENRGRDPIKPPGAGPSRRDRPSRASWSSATWSTRRPDLDLVRRPCRCSARANRCHSAFGRRPTDRQTRLWKPSGAEVLLAPTVQILPIEDFQPLDEAIGRLNSFDWLVFTSGNGVRHFLDRLDAIGLDLRALGSIELAAIGPSTAEALARYRLKADLVPESFRSEALAEALAGRVSGKRVLLARADRGRTILKDELERIAQVQQVAVYRNADAEALPPSVLERIEEGSVDWITLTSSAIAERLLSLLPESARRQIGRTIRLASLSPVTSSTIAKLGYPVAVEASSYTWDGLVEAIVTSRKDLGS